MSSTSSTSRDDILAILREQVRRIEGGCPSSSETIVSTGCPELDRLLPDGGMRRGTLTEWLGEDGAGAGTLALLAARSTCGEGKLLVVIDRAGDFYPPAVAAWGMDVGDLLLVRPKNQRDEIWAFDQCLRCQAVAAVWNALGQVSSRSFRRLQLAAEAGGSIGLLVRSPQRVREPTWAEFSLGVRPWPADGPRRFRVEVLRCRGRRAGAAGEFEINEAAGMIRGASVSDEADPVQLVPPLARAARPRRQAGT